MRDVPEPRLSDGEVLIDVVRVGLCGTDADIERGQYGRAPEGSDVLVLGHESFGRVARDAGSLKAGTPVVASVRRPDGCPNCLSGEQDMCLWGGYRERGINGIHGFCAERFVERPEYLFVVSEAIADVAVLLEPLTIAEKGWRHLAAAQRRMTVWEPRTAIVAGGALAFARAIGEFGALVLIAGKVQIASIVIFADVENDSPQAAASLSVVLLLVALLVLFLIRRVGGRGAH